jgi:hypothetical protein
VIDDPDCVHRWRAQLAERIGMGDAEIERQVAALAAYCTQHDVGPFTLLAAWEQRSELTVRRRPGAGEPANLAVASFLIHNGVNVFGEIVCVAGQPEDLALQGPQFVPES